MTPRTRLDQTFLLIHTSNNNDLASIHGQIASVGTLGWSTKHQGTWEESVHCVWVIGIGRVPDTWSLQWPEHQLQPLLAAVPELGEYRLRPSPTDQPLWKSRFPTEKSQCTIGAKQIGVWVHWSTHARHQALEQLCARGTPLRWWVWSVWVSAMLPQLQGHCQRGPPPSHPILSPEM